MMGAFRFRLQKIKELRVRAEEDAARELGRRLSLRLAKMQELARMSADKRNLLEIRNELQRGRVEPPRLAQNRYQIIVLEKATTQRQAELQILDAEVADAQAQLAERSRDRKLMDRLEERRREEHELEQRRLAQRELDEIPNAGHGTGIAMSAMRKHRG